MMLPSRAKYGITISTTVVATATLLAADLGPHWLKITSETSSDAGVRSAVFGALIAMASLFITVLLGVLSVVTSIQERDIVKSMKAAGVYNELIHRLIGPVKSSFVLITGAVICIILPAPTEASSVWELVHKVIVCLTLSLGLGVMFQTGAIATYLGRVLLAREDEIGDEEGPAAARRRLGARQPDSPDEPRPPRKLETAAVSG